MWVLRFFVHRGWGFYRFQDFIHVFSGDWSRGSEFENSEKIPSAKSPNPGDGDMKTPKKYRKSQNPGDRYLFRDFCSESGFFREMVYPDKNQTLIFPRDLIFSLNGTSRQKAFALDSWRCFSVRKKWPSSTEISELLLLYQYHIIRSFDWTWDLMNPYLT